ncbi:hypothetical protein [Facklamia lactis]|uniref:hypothetical protein n=1 Tax=Facklamia lactis TaxID=2749967 RepID=UPI0018CF1313|nr:hypothetical protein [Facklamia lactis]MBG9980765.1 hypothetical protein [Facklamia lactis]
MKKPSWISVCLVIFILLNVLLTYFLIDTKAIYDLYQRIAVNEELKPQVETSIIEDTYFQAAQPELSDIMSPHQIMIREKGRYYYVHQSKIMADIRDTVEEPIIELDGNQPQINPVELGDIMKKDHYQFIYVTKLALPLLSDLIRDSSEVETQFQINRIIIPKDDSRKVYLVDSINKSFLEAHLNDTINLSTLSDSFDKVAQTWIEMDEYTINRDTVYLPKTVLASPSQVYTLEKVPENIFIEPVFEGEAFDITEPDANNIRSYHTFVSSLMIDDDTNMMTVSKSGSQKNVPSRSESQLVSQYHQVTGSLEIVKDFTYWNMGFRFFSEQGNMITYRRYLAGMPIFAHPELPDYGANKVSLKYQGSQASLDRLQMSLLILGTHVSDQSQSQIVESGQEIRKILEDNHLKFSQFNQILLGFEWQKEMENFKKVTLIPKWFFVIGNEIYSIDQIKDGTVSEKYASALVTKAGNGINLFDEEMLSFLWVDNRQKNKALI